MITYAALIEVLKLDILTRIYINQRSGYDIAEWLLGCDSRKEYYICLHSSRPKYLWPFLSMFSALVKFTHFHTELMALKRRLFTSMLSIRQQGVALRNINNLKTARNCIPLCCIILVGGGGMGPGTQTTVQIQYIVRSGSCCGPPTNSASCARAKALLHKPPDIYRLWQPIAEGLYSMPTHSLSLSLLLRPTVSRPVCLGAKHPSGAYDQIFITCVTVTVLFLWGALSDERSGLSFVCAAGPCQRSLSRVRIPWDLRPYFTVTHLRLPFRRLLRLAGSRWRYSTPPPHG
jgi:hypothetical protein